jgi:aminomethyltransferase
MRIATAQALDQYYTSSRIPKLQMTAPEGQVMQSPLHQRELGQGASFGDHWGWEIAEKYGDPMAEYRAARHGCGALNLFSYGKLRVEGRDRVRYLHNMLSNDIKKLPVGNGCHATLLTRQGRMETDLYVVAGADWFWLECPPAGTGAAFRTLNQHIVGDVVSVEDRTESFGILSLQGPGSRAKMSELTGIALEGMAPLQSRSAAGGGSFVVRRDRTGCDGYDLWLPAGETESVWSDWMDGGGILPVGLTAWNYLRTEAGIPWFGVDMDESNLPMEFGLQSAISMTKGCYRGQEVVARVAHRGHLDRVLAGIAVESPVVPEKGWEVFSGDKKIGTVTSAIFSPILGKPLALCILHTAYTEPGTQVYVTGRYAAEVVRLPV